MEKNWSSRNWSFLPGNVFECYELWFSKNLKLPPNLRIFKFWIFQVLDSLNSCSWFFKSKIYQIPDSSNPKQILKILVDSWNPWFLKSLILQTLDSWHPWFISEAESNIFWKLRWTKLLRLKANFWGFSGFLSHFVFKGLVQLGPVELCVRSWVGLDSLLALLAWSQMLQTTEETWKDYFDSSTLTCTEANHRPSPDKRATNFRVYWSIKNPFMTSSLSLSILYSLNLTTTRDKGKCSWKDFVVWIIFVRLLVAWG